MAGIQGIFGLTSPGGTGPVNERPAKRGDIRAESGTVDHVSISSTARDVAEVSKLAATSPDEVRRQRVEEARRSIEEGTYRLVNVIELVAARISPHLG